jgi:hypothetical protein
MLASMHSAQDYRKWAAQAERLATGAVGRELQEQLEAIAREYEAIADRIETGVDQCPNDFGCDLSCRFGKFGGGRVAAKPRRQFKAC